MKKQWKFLLGGVAVVGLIGNLVSTGMSEAMLLWLTPTELVAKVAADPTMHETGVKVGAHVVPGSIQFNQRTLDLRFEVTDIEGGSTRFPVTYQGPLPDTFTDDMDVIVEGHFTSAGVFEATNVITKCGSRYEAEAEDFLS